MRLALKGGRVIDPSRSFDEIGDLIIENGLIAGFVKGESQINADEIIDCKGLIVTPGWIDMHVHTREPGFEYKEDILSAAEAAAVGGFTTIVGMPNTNPAVDNRAVVEYILNKAKLAKINVLTTGAATKNNGGLELAEIGDMIDAGAVAISDDAFPVQNADLMRMVMQYSSMFDVPVMAHCEDKSMTKDATINEGISCTMLGLKAWPREAEEIMISRNILLSKLTGCKLHIQHITTSGGVEAVRWAKKSNIKVTAETCPQYFSLTDEALLTYDTNAKVCPPLRTQQDIDSIIEALKDGTIDAIATDHAPHATQDKEVELQYAAFGMVGLETALSLVITNLVKTKKLTMNEAVAKVTCEPAKILGINKGTLSDGSIADITIFDPDAKITVDSKKFKSKSKNTAFEGKELFGKVAAVIADGKVIYKNEN